MNVKVFIFITILCHFTRIDCHLFLRGRPLNKHGMLGRPATKLNFKDRNSVPEAQWFEQRLDHFNPADARTWKQRYFVNDTFYESGGPVFLQLGGEGTADPIWLVEGQIATNYAPKFKAMSVLLEHRYYGASHPTEDTSVANLQYLTSEQALADAANFIAYLTATLKLENSKWIVFGGSYSGSLAAWFRLKYPHLVNGAIASSAPVEAVIDFQDYLAVVRDSLGQKCDNAIQEATDTLTKLLQTPDGWKSIQKNFMLCDTLNGTNKFDVYNLMSNLAGNFEGVVQYNKDNREFEGALATNITIDVICDVMTDESKGSAYQRYALVNQLILDAYMQKCVDFKYDKFVKQMSQTNWNESASEGGRQWTYQTCVEFGFFQSSDLKTQPFGDYFPVDFFVQQCTDIFGSKFDVNLLKKAVQFTNTNYGGFNITVRKVVFPNGSIDPWHALGIVKDLNPEAKAIYINGTAHCADMYPDSDLDPQQLISARMSIAESLAQFLE